MPRPKDDRCFGHLASDRDACERCMPAAWPWSGDGPSTQPAQPVVGSERDFMASGSRISASAGADQTKATLSGALGVGIDCLQDGNHPLGPERVFNHCVQYELNEP